MIKELRKKLGWTVGKLAEYIGASERSVYRWENHSDEFPPPIYLEKLMKYIIKYGE